MHRADTAGGYREKIELEGDVLVQKTAVQRRHFMRKTERLQEGADARRDILLDDQPSGARRRRIGVQEDLELDQACARSSSSVRRIRIELVDQRAEVIVTKVRDTDA